MKHSWGVAVTTLGIATLSPDSVLVRLVASDGKTTLFWRGIAMAIGATLILAVRDRATTVDRNMKILRRRESLLLALFFVGANISFVVSIKYAPVADALGSLATTSIFAALFSAVFLRQRLSRRVWLAAFGVGIGLFLITLYGGGHLSGRLTSIAAALFFAATLIAMKLGDDIDPLPAVGLCGAMLAVMFCRSAALANIDTLQVSAIVGLGLILPLSMQLVGYGTQLLSPAEVSLLMLLETVLGTLWAWLVLGETPALITITAIVIILSTLALFYGTELWLHHKVRRVS